MTKGATLARDVLWNVRSENLDLQTIRANKRVQKNILRSFLNCGEVNTASICCTINLKGFVMATANKLSFV